MMQRLRIGEIGFDIFRFEEALSRILMLSKAQRGSYVVTPNVDHVVRAESDPVFARIVNEASLVLPDGMPVVWASKILGQRMPGRIAGADLAPALCARAAARKLSVFLLGGMPGEVELAAEMLQKKFPQLKIAGTYFPPFGFENDPGECTRIVQAIGQVSPDIVFVGVGSPKQEKWIYAWRHIIDAGVFIGVGATIGFMAGTLRRAPVWMQRIGLEWLYRFSQEPRRLFLRYLSDIAFFPIVLRSYCRVQKFDIVSHTAEE